MRKVPDVKGGFVLVPVKDALKIASALRGYEEILYAASGPKKEKESASWDAYFLETACSNHSKENGKSK